MHNVSEIDAKLLREFSGSRFLIAAGGFEVFGGAERQAILLARELISKYQCHVDFIGWDGEGIFADHVRSVGATPIIFPFDITQRGIDRALALFRLARFIRRDLKPDYLLPYVGLHCKIIGSIWKWTGAKFCWWNQRDEGRLIYGTRTERRLISALPAIVSNSFEGRDFLIRKFGLSERRIQVINNGVELPAECDRTIWRKQLQLGDEDILITMIANLTKYKDHATLLKAFAEVRKTAVGGRCHLVLAGRHGDATESLKAMAFDLGLCGALTMPGPVADVNPLLAASDLVVHSSTTEGCPNGVLEAMANGRCVVGTSISGIRQALGDHAQTECLSPGGDWIALAQLIRKMACSPDLRDELGTKNKQRIENQFSIDNMVRDVLTTISESLGVPKRAKSFAFGPFEFRNG
jgi:glycosyltransferase involved in cell wall biosynthesis